MQLEKKVSVERQTGAVVAVRVGDGKPAGIAVVGELESCTVGTEDGARAVARFEVRLRVSFGSGSC